MAYTIALQNKIANDKSISGGKGAALSFMLQNGIAVPVGFVITVDAFAEFQVQNNLDSYIAAKLAQLEADASKLEVISQELQKGILSASLPISTMNEILTHAKKLNSLLAVRSSAIGEDGSKDAWAGQLESYLNIQADEVTYYVKKCWASLFAPRSLQYMQKTSSWNNSMAIVIQKMVASDISGVAFSVNPSNQDSSQILVEAVTGLSERLVSGSVKPETFIVDKKTAKVKQGKNSLLSIQQLQELVTTIKKLEVVFTFPLDIEWAFNKRLFIIQARPITTIRNIASTVSVVLEKIAAHPDWAFYVNRKFNWLVEHTRVLASGSDLQEKHLGFSTPVINYLAVNGDEYFSQQDIKQHYQKFTDLFLANTEFFSTTGLKVMAIMLKATEYLENLQATKLHALTNVQLAEEIDRFYRHYLATFVATFLRPDYYLETTLKERLKTKYKLSGIELDELFFKIATCSDKCKLAYSEEPLELLYIVKAIQTGGYTLTNLPPSLQTKINQHIHRYSWMKAPISTEHSSFAREDYLQRISFLLKQDANEKIRFILQSRENNQLNYINIFKKYGLDKDPEIWALTEAVRSFVFLRSYVSETTDHLFYVAKETLLVEAAQRINLNINDIIMLQPEEIQQGLREGTRELKAVIAQRKKGFAVVWLNQKVQQFFGDQAIVLQQEAYKLLLPRIVTTNNSSIIAGKVANVGKVQGRVKIITDFSATDQINEGDILVTSMTTPDLIAATEKAAAFVTDKGGITCHAAIIAREFNVPCIVGTTNGTKILKNNQLVEVDAYLGVVKLLKE